MVKLPRRRWIYFLVGLVLLLAAVPVILLVRPNLLGIILQPWKDWGQVSYYQKVNAKLKANEPGRIVFFGDSEIQLWKIANDFPGKPYVNRGIGGQTTEQMMLRFR